MKTYKKLVEFERDEYIVTVHTSPDCKPETLVALGEMMGHLIKQIEGRTNADLQSIRCPGCGELKLEEKIYCTNCGTDLPRR